VIHKFITSVFNKEELLDQWKEPIIVTSHKNGEKTAIIIMGISLLSASYTVLLNNLVSWLSQYIEEII
jgi:hypothetical protein